jgi:hypothetical protein
VASVNDLPLLPHCDLDPECCGCLSQVVIAGETHFKCNECGIVLSKEEVAPLIPEMESTEAVFPHCGKMNEISGFSELMHSGAGFAARGQKQHSRNPAPLPRPVEQRYTGRCVAYGKALETTIPSLGHSGLAGSGMNDRTRT